MVSKVTGTTILLNKGSVPIGSEGDRRRPSIIISRAKTRLCGLTRPLVELPQFVLTGKTEG